MRTGTTVGIVGSASFPKDWAPPCHSVLRPVRSQRAALREISSKKILIKKKCVCQT